MSLYAALKSNGATGFGYGSTAETITEGLDLTGKTYLVTGCNSGLGAETARVLALRGAKLIGLARTEASARTALAPLGSTHAAVACDLSEPSSVRAAVATVRALDLPIDALIANAGIMALPKLEQKHGLELQFLTNHIGHFVLVTGLLDRLTPSGRVVMLSSGAHNRAPEAGIAFDDLSASKSYDAWRNYGQSKLANLLFARELAKRLPAGQTANAVHPGVIRTNLGRHMSSWIRVVFSVANPLFLKRVDQGAATQCYVAAHPAAASVTGEYWADCNVATSSTHGQDKALAARLWDETERLVAALPA